MKTRIGAQILLLNGYCYQSFNWKYLRPLGSLSTIIKLLDVYEVDEICITRPIKGGSDKYFSRDCRVLSTINSNTPITLGGGIRKIEDLKFFHNLPLERVCLNSAFLEGKNSLIKKVKESYGKQSIIYTMPLKIFKGQLYIYNSCKNSFLLLNQRKIEKFKDFINEYYIIDTDNEGYENKFNFDLIKRLNIEPSKIIISGGIGAETIKIAKKLNLASVIIENRYFYKELNNFKQ